MSAMTLEQVSYHLREKKTTADDLLADAIDAHLTAHAQMVEKVREVIADIEGSRGDEEDLYWFGRWSDQLRHAIGDKP